MDKYYALAVFELNHMAAVDSDGQVSTLDGSPIPSEEQIQAKIQGIKKRKTLRRKAILAKSFVEQEQQAAQQQAIDELVAKRSAEVLAASPKALYVQKAQENRAKFEADLQALAELGDT